MGLGKTLSMIALISSDHDRDVGNSLTVGYSSDADKLHSTLVVVPLSSEKKFKPHLCALIANILFSH